MRTAAEKSMAILWKSYFTDTYLQYVIAETRASARESLMTGERLQKQQNMCLRILGDKYMPCLRNSQLVDVFLSSVKHGDSP